MKDCHLNLGKKLFLLFKSFENKIIAKELVHSIYLSQCEKTEGQFFKDMLIFYAEFKIIWELIIIEKEKGRNYFKQRNASFRS